MEGTKGPSESLSQDAMGCNRDGNSEQSSWWVRAEQAGSGPDWERGTSSRGCVSGFSLAQRGPEGVGDGNGQRLGVLRALEAEWGSCRCSALGSEP